MTMKASKETRNEVFNALGYKPSIEQEKVLFSDLEDQTIRIKQVVGGERSGKSDVTEKEILSRYVEGKLYWLGGADYSIPRKEFEYLVEDAQKLYLMIPGSLVMHNDVHSECSLMLRGGIKVVTKSFKDIHKAMTRESPDGIAICEAALCTWEDVERCITRVAESRGWVFLSSTMEGSMGYFPEKYKEWQAPNAEGGRSFSMPSWSNLAVYPLGRVDPEILRQEVILPDDKFMERFGGLPCPLSNYVIPDFRNEIHVGNFPFDPELDVEIAVDPGWAGAYAVLATQWRGDVCYVVDEIYLQGYITQDIIEIAQKKLWYKKMRSGVIDIAAKQHQAMPAPIDVWRKLTGIGLRCNKIEEEAGIDRLRTFMKPHPVTKQPQLYIHHTCKGLISEFGGGRPPDGIINGGAWLRDRNTGKPLEKNNHACKSLYYLLIDKYGYVTVKRANYGRVTSLSPFV